MTKIKVTYARFVAYCRNAVQRVADAYNGV